MQYVYIPVIPVLSTPFMNNLCTNTKKIIKGAMIIKVAALVNIESFIALIAEIPPTDKEMDE